MLIYRRSAFYLLSAHSDIAHQFVHDLSLLKLWEFLCHFVLVEEEKERTSVSKSLFPLHVVLQTVTRLIIQR